MFSRPSGTQLYFPLIPSDLSLGYCHLVPTGLFNQMLTIDYCLLWLELVDDMKTQEAWNNLRA